MAISDTVRAELRDALLTATEDRPEHRAFLDDLLAVADSTLLDEDERWDAINDAANTPPAGVSDAIADALTQDVMWLTIESYREHPSQYPRGYRARRLHAARAAAARRKNAAQRGPKSLADALSFLRR